MADGQDKTTNATNATPQKATRAPITPRPPKGIDGFQARLIGLFDWLVTNSKYVWMVLIPVLAILVVGLGFQAVMDSQSNKRRAALGAIEEIYANEAIESGKKREEIQKKIDEIEAASNPGTASKPQSIDVQKLIQKSQLEKDRDAIRPDHSGSRDKFAAFFKEHGDTPEGWLAGIRAANIWLADRKTSEAKPIVEQVAKESLSMPWFQFQSRMLLVSLYEDAGEFDAALKELEIVDRLAVEDLKPKVKLAKGRIQLLKDSKDEARATLDEIISQHGSTPEAQKARSWLALIN
jgi:predicted negative regulator of RcsB-dependent stress response